MNQRWREGRASYRPAGEVIRTAAFEVAEIPDDRTAKRFVELHHYSGSFPAARWRFGLYERGELVGVSVLSQPGNNATPRKWLDCSHLQGVELGRFVLLDRVPGNGETWFLARCFELLRRNAAQLRGVISFSDPQPRTTVDGRVVMPGHVGTIYQAFNGVYTGRTKAERMLLLPDGRVMSPRALSKVRQLEQGWRHVVEKLQRYGAGEFDPDDREWWLTHWTVKLCRSFKHPGNHRYLWALDRFTAKGLRRRFAEPLPYPKTLRAA